MTNTPLHIERDLLPCPFCGGEASVIGIRDGRQVSCKGQPRTPCFAKGPAVYHGPGGWEECEAEAITAWNQRQPLSGWQEERADAAKWRSLMACQRIRVMGFTHDGNHMGVEFWREHPEAHPSAEYRQDACRERFDTFASAIRQPPSGGRDDG